MNKALTLSIVIPVYNEEIHLGSCLESIMAQTISPTEIIVVDNNSTDNSAKIAKEFPLVRVVNEKEQGVINARTTGFNVASGQIIGRIDAETRLEPGWVEKIHKIFQDKTIDAVSGPVGYHDAPAEKAVLFFDKTIRMATWKIGKIDDAVFLFGGNMALRKKAWDDVSKYLCNRRDVHEDIDIAIHLDELGKKVVFDKNLVAYTSSRRMDDPIMDFYKYLRVYKNTYNVHNIYSPAITMTSAIVFASRFGVNLVRRGYDPASKKFSIKKFIDNPDEPRVHPM